MDNETTTEVAKQLAKKTFQKWLIGILLSSAPFLLGIFVVFIAVFFVLGLFDGDNSGGSSGSQGGGYAYVMDGKKVSNIKVRLLKCEGNEPIPDEELIDFDYYIVGVVYQEIGNAPYEAIKAQAIAARSYALTRAKAMGEVAGLSLKEENGEWILSIRSCTNDQVFCNPDKGCWSKVPGGQTDPDNPSNDSECTVYSGTTDNETYWFKGPLSSDSEIRKAVQETQGEVLVDSENNIVYTSYTSVDQNNWIESANNGSDYFEILSTTYGTDVKLEKPEYIVESVEGNGIATSKYAHPCPELIRVASRFGPRCLAVGAQEKAEGCVTKMHKGIDLGADTGKKVYAFDGGTVTLVAGGCVVGDLNCNGQAGNYISINHGNGMITRYLHLSKMFVKSGQKVSVGQLIGEVGNTGRSTGPHLHFDIQYNGEFVNPENYYNFKK